MQGSTGDGIRHKNTYRKAFVHYQQHNFIPQANRTLNNLPTPSTHTHTPPLNSKNMYDHLSTAVHKNTSVGLLRAGRFGLKNPRFFHKNIRFTI